MQSAIMSFNVTSLKPSIPLKRQKAHSGKVRSGCITCRIRRVKCDEGKPGCQRCVKTGRHCDGYESMFRQFGEMKQKTTLSIAVPHPKSLIMDLKFLPQEVDTLSRLLSVKPETGFRVRYEAEARDILQATVTEPAIRHAVISLGSLREEYEQNGLLSVRGRSSPAYLHGIQEYNKAITRLAQRLSVPSPETLRAALLCCQLFISIEIMQSNYDTAVQHFVRGIRIMHDYGMRPFIGSEGKHLLGRLPNMPFVDIFVIKLLAPPCAGAYHFYASPSAGDRPDGIATPFEYAMMSPVPSPEKRFVLEHRTKLVALADSISKLLTRISHVRTTTEALLLVNEKQALLNRLQDWFNEVKHLSIIGNGPEDIDPPTPKATHPGVGYLFLFHSILKSILILALTSPTSVLDDLSPELLRMKHIAKFLTEFKDPKTN